jgi:hypothetical protein
MAQADQTVQNATFPTVRADINDNLAALFTDSSGNTAPSVTVAFQDWIDTSGADAVWKKRNAANNAWLTVATFLGSGLSLGGFDSGTVMLFVQTAAPTGWTKSTTHDNKALRIVSGSAASGGSSGFTTAFNSSGSVGATTLTTAQIPSHTHTVARASEAGGFTTTAAPGASPVGTISTSATGGGDSHTHSISFDVAYVDVIIATKD